MYTVAFTDSIATVDGAVWDTLAASDYPFISHAFLSVLETSGAVGGDSGWQPQHILVWRGSELIAGMPSYLKSHSYGEYVFDFAWADAWHRYGREYYPKLISAIPFSPITGPRLCLAADEDEAEVIAAIRDAVVERMAGKEFSSWHLLFPEKSLSDRVSAQMLQRRAVHFQWRNEGYGSFDDFLADFSSRKRKNLRKERDRVRDAGITFDVIDGRDITEKDWDDYYLFYQITYARRSGHGGYLARQFFSALSAGLSQSIVLIMARREGRAIAGALNFRDSTTLYGRYWGCREDFDFLHFETCYYQGIEYCIREGLERFDPGVQGEHKLQRGFRPTYTWSNHLVGEQPFRTAIADYLLQEGDQIDAYYQDALGYLPFRQPD